VEKIEKPLPPLICVASTAGAAAEVTQFAIIVDSHRKVKMTIGSKSLVPDIAIIDPVLLSTKDARLTANTGIDALTHAIEAYVSVAATPITDINALRAIKMISTALRASVASRTNMEAKTQMAMASLLAGVAMSNAILGAVHAMAHPLGGLLNLPHGVGFLAASLTGVASKSLSPGWPWAKRSTWGKTPFSGWGSTGCMLYLFRKKLTSLKTAAI